MPVALRADRNGDRASLVPTGSFDLPHATAVAQATEDIPSVLDGCRSIDVDLSNLDRIDGAGAVLLARFLDRLDADGPRTRVVEDQNPEAARLIALYRSRRVDGPAVRARAMSALARIGTAGAQLPVTLNDALNFIGRCAAAVPKTVAIPGSVDWRSLPRADRGDRGERAPRHQRRQSPGRRHHRISRRIAARPLRSGRLRSGARGRRTFPGARTADHGSRRGGKIGRGSCVRDRHDESVGGDRRLAIDGVRPGRWLVVPRCLALAVTVPLLTWVGDVLALIGGLVATTVITDMTPRAYVLATSDAITASHLLAGLIKTPFLALAIGLIACGQGLATQGGAAAVGARTTSAVVLAIFGVIVINALFTLFFALMGI